MKHIAVLALAALVAGCSAPVMTVTATTTSTVTVTSAPAAPTTSARATPSKAPTLAMGEPFEAVDFTASVLEYRPTVDTFGGQRQAVLVNFCLTNAPKGESGLEVSWHLWALSDGAGGAFTPESSTMQNSLQPQFPFFGRVLAPGECAKGWVEFTSADAAKQAQLILNHRAVLTWTLA